MLQLRTILLSTLSLVGFAAADSVLALDSKNFDATAFAGVPSLVEFYAPWCGHCKKLAPDYELLSQSFSSSKAVNIAKVDGDEHKDLSSKYGISGFPTIKWFDGKSKDPEDYKGGRDLESFQSFITEKTGVRPKKEAKMPSQVEMLDDKTFNSAIGGDKDVLVAFTAPWCGHCKTLAPIYEKVAEDYMSDSVVIAKVDAEANKDVSGAEGVKSYPTIKFYPKGSKKAIDYEGGRDEASFLTYLNEKAGLHRVPGGALDATAGTIEALDTVISSLKEGYSNLPDITTQLTKAAKGLTDQYAGYYVKVLGKLAGNSGYLEKEMGRLEGILKKGGLERSKTDDLSSRLNVLKKFVAEKVEQIKEEL